MDKLALKIKKVRSAFNLPQRRAIVTAPDPQGSRKAYRRINKTIRIPPTIFPERSGSVREVKADDNNKGKY
jgi:hypothetical protein|tara:strand:+ start:1601 stop:1813 length:213 start_codon:yes stop_codon:yes gene_type:complete